jgi:sn-glycerol 3-phosphate transport system permease protein
MIGETTFDRVLIRGGGALLALIWIAPLAYAVWAAFHPPAFEARFELTAPLTLDNFASAWSAGAVRALFPQHHPAGDDDPERAAGAVHARSICLRAARISRQDGAVHADPDAVAGHAGHPAGRELQDDAGTRTGRHDHRHRLPYFASGFAIFLLRQTFMTIPKELDEAARVEGCSLLGLLWRVYVPLGKPAMLAFGLVSVSHHWNNFLWPLIITNSVETRPLTVGLSIFATTDSGTEWAVINAATLMTSAPLLLGFLLFQRQFVQSFMRAGIK